MRSINQFAQAEIEAAKSRFLAKFWKEPGTECWLWRDALSTSGYGKVHVTEKQYIMAHRFSFEIVNGPIPDGFQLDHLCRTRHCVNPVHLEIVTNRINVLRGVGLSAENARKTHCFRGHEFTEANTRWVTANGRPQRLCVICQRIKNRLCRRRAGIPARCNTYSEAPYSMPGTGRRRAVRKGK